MTLKAGSRRKWCDRRGNHSLRPTARILLRARAPVDPPTHTWLRVLARDSSRRSLLSFFLSFKFPASSAAFPASGCALPARVPRELLCSLVRVRSCSAVFGVRHLRPWARPSPRGRASLCTGGSLRSLPSTIVCEINSQFNLPPPSPLIPRFCCEGALRVRVTSCHESQSE